jgi:Domain of unknown function (DUF4157)
MTAHAPGFASLETPPQGARWEELPPDLRRRLEAILCCDLSAVRIAVDARLIPAGALACAQGETIRLSPAAPDLRTPAGVAMLGHELAHVLQQRAGRVSVTTDGAIVNDPALESEADMVGLHCAARLFRDSISDPGMPAIANAAGLPPCRGPMPVQFISSRESFEALVNATWNYLNLPLTELYSDPYNLKAIYSWAANYNPNGVSPKNALSGKPLYVSMFDYTKATVPYKIVLQTTNDWPDITKNVPAFLKYYAEKAEGLSPTFNELAERLTISYLHIYPAKPAKGNWRIALNVIPADMAAAMTALAPLLEADKFPDIDHVKFLSPGNPGKADSVIVYLNRTEEGYDKLRDAILEAIVGIKLQKRVGCMVEEIAPGIGEIAESPVDYISATEYRCLVIYLAFWNFLKKVEKPTFETFEMFLADVMSVFGLDAERPYLQGKPATEFMYFDSWWEGMLMLYNAWAKSR